MNIPRTLYRISLLCLLLGASPAQAVSISETPLFLTQGVVPNLVMSFDDSGSMGWGYVPDALRATQAKLDGPRFTAASYNPIYYNPKVTYSIPTRLDNVAYITSFTQAYINGFDRSLGYADLSNSTAQSGNNQKGYKPIAEYFNNTQSSCTSYANADVNVENCRIVRNQGSTKYSYSSCKVVFTRQTGNDRIDVSGCSASFVNDSNIAADRILTINGAGAGYDGSYLISAVNSTTRLTLNTDFSVNATKNGVTLSWSYPPIDSAYYSLYYTDKAGAAKPAGCTDSKDNDACYLLITVGSSDDLAVRGGTAAQSQQNFANWYSFYRTRALASLSAAMRAITSLKNNEVRLAWQTINADTACSASSNTSSSIFGTNCQDYSGTAHENRIRPLDAVKTGSTSGETHRTDFYNWLQKFDVYGGTPLRYALQRVGNYFTTSGVNSPYAEDPYVTQGTELACRKNFHILFTDGLWNADSLNIGDIDSTNRSPLPDGTSYTAINPFKDGYSDTLADLAFTYWATDLRPGLTNNVAPVITDRSGSATQQYWNPKNNPATWQHLVNYTIGLGLSSYLTDPLWGGSTYAGDYSALVAGTKSWPSMATSEANHVYDLWHAAINSRGQFFNADSPDGLITAFQSAMNSILAANPSAAALSANSTSIQTGTLVYQARFDSTDWHGELLAYPIQGDGSIGSAAWNAATLIPSASARKIFTFDGSTGRDFTDCTTSSINAAQKSALDTNAAGTVDNQCSSRLAWLRGDASLEARNGGAFRNRTVSALGDIVNSDPAYVKNEDYGYGSTYSGLTSAEKTSYASYLLTKASRTPVVYVGANDGMLHAFRADTGNTNSGKELFAFIPAGVYGNLSKLTATNYSHKTFVDGAPSSGDAYLSSGWKTVLVGGLGAGGKSIYALNITNPDSFSASNVMWEFTDTDMGYSFSQPQIARLHNGQWAAIFGNGYNSTAGYSYLYIVNLENGSLIRKIVLGGETNNGLSTPFVYDKNNDSIADAVYAGDLQGNLWKITLEDSNSANWSVTNNGFPLYVARDSSGQIHQPITAQPKVSAHSQGGVLVYFGTGIYLGTSDVSNLQVQSFYAVRDNGNVNTLWRSNLQAQSITAETNEFGYELRETSNNPVDWVARQGWYLDLVPPSGAAGERVVSTSIVKYDRVIFVTMIPSNDPCQPGGSSWIMELSTQTGGRPDTSPFDFNNDYKFDSADLLTTGSVATGVKSTQGIAKTPVWLESGKNDGMAFKELSGTLGGIMTLKNKGKPITSNAPQRIYWKQIL